jgi:CheY-like chemotaxis protein
MTVIPNTVRGGSPKPAGKPVVGRVNSIGIHSRELHELLDLLDAEELPRSKSRKRTFTRLNYRKESIPITLCQPGGTEMQVQLASRNLSRGGISLLHNCFVYTGTICRVCLTDLTGKKVTLSGSVSFCSHRTGNLHELGVRFTSPIVLRAYIDERAVVDFHEYETVDVSRLKGHVLLIDSDPKSERLIKSLLNETGLRIKTVCDPTVALQEINEDYALLLVNEQLTGIQGIALMEQIRELGCATPAILVTSNASSILASGLTGISGVSNPPSGRQLLSRIAERLLIAPEAESPNTKGGRGR